MDILEWMFAQAAYTINKFLVGHDGRTACCRVRHNNFHVKGHELDEQVVKPQRINRQFKKKGALGPRVHDATWLGYNGRSNEQTVLLKEGGPAIKVRTVRPTAEGEEDPGANAIREAWTLVLREGSYFQAGFETRAGLEQKLQNQKSRLGRPDGGM